MKLFAVNFWCWVTGGIDTLSTVVGNAFTAFQTAASGIAK